MAVSHHISAPLKRKHFRENVENAELCSGGLKVLKNTRGKLLYSFGHVIGVAFPDTHPKTSALIEVGLVSLFLLKFIQSV